MNEITPEDVERLIDEAGRTEVFDRAKALGWTDGHAPLWVWAQIAGEVKRGEPLLVPLPFSPARTDEAILGFRLW